MCGEIGVGCGLVVLVVMWVVWILCGVELWMFVVGVVDY